MGNVWATRLRKLPGQPNHGKALIGSRKRLAV